MPSSNLLEKLPDELASLIEQNEDCKVFVDGRFQPHLSSKNGMDSDLVIPPNTKAKIHYLFIYKDQNQSDLKKNIVISDQAEVDVTETHVGLVDIPFQCESLLNISVRPGAKLNHQRLLKLGGASKLSSGAHITAHRDAQLTVTQLTLGGGHIRNNVTAELVETGAAAHLYGLTLGKNKEHIDNTTFVHHKVGYTASTQIYKNLLADSSRVDFNGRLVIEEDAQKSDASQLNQNLMLGDRAEANTTPQLEVFADDVKAAHGATVGQIDEEQIFYLMSRALTREQSVKFLTNGFLQDIVERMPEGQRARGRAFIEGVQV